MPGFNLANYTDVNSRMKLARDTWQSITVHDPQMLTETFGFIKATVVLHDGRTVTEACEFRLDLQTRSAQATNPIGDAATGAIGRALGRFGFGTDAHFPSREEMEQIPADRSSPVEAAAKQAPVQTINANLKRKADVMPEDARAKFYEHFGPSLAHPEATATWMDVRYLLKMAEDEPEPQTVEGWRSAWRMVDEALRREAQQAA